MSASPAFDVGGFEASRRSRGVALGAPLHWRAETGSTNDDAVAAARAGAPEGTTFVVDHQRAGRGRRGRTWHAEPGASLLFSVVLRPALPLERIGCLSLAVGLAVRDALGRCLPELDAAGLLAVKWPNDVWARGRKIAGVLAESQIEAGALRSVVVGVGINVATTKFPAELAERATSIRLAGGDVGREPLLLEVLDTVARVTATLSESGFPAIHARLCRSDALLERRLRVSELEGDRVLEGHGGGIDTLGRLLVRLERGHVVPIAAGTVEIVD